MSSQFSHHNRNNPSKGVKRFNICFHRSQILIFENNDFLKKISDSSEIIRQNTFDYSGKTCVIKNSQTARNKVFVRNYCLKKYREKTYFSGTTLTHLEKTKKNITRKRYVWILRNRYVWILRQSFFK